MVTRTRAVTKEIVAEEKFRSHVRISKQIVTTAYRHWLEAQEN